MKFDIIFTNPPYNKNIDIQILNNVVSYTNELVAIHPSLWLMDKKRNNSTFNSLRDKINGKVRNLELFNGNMIFGGITVNSPIVVTHVDNSYAGEVQVDYFGDKYSCQDVYDVNKFGSEWFTLVKPFSEQIKTYISGNLSIWSQKVSGINLQPDKFYCQLAGTIGHVNLKSNTHVMVKDDFYTMTIKDNRQNKGIRKPELTNTYCFDNTDEVENFLSYLQTDFARFCLCIYKNNVHIDSGEMDFIPWMDFSETWDDDKLFKHFDVSDVLQQYIRNFLPDYYSIRK